VLRHTGAVGHAIEIQRAVAERFAHRLEIGNGDARGKESRIVGQRGQAVTGGLEYLFLAVSTLDDVIVDITIHVRRRAGAALVDEQDVTVAADVFESARVG
jgi:hypothetical protein